MHLSNMNKIALPEVMSSTNPDPVNPKPNPNPPPRKKGPKEFTMADLPAQCTGVLKAK